MRKSKIPNFYDASRELADKWVVLEFSNISNEWRFCGSGVTYFLREAGLYDNPADAISYVLNHKYTTEKDSDYYLAAMPVYAGVRLVPFTLSVRKKRANVVKR